MIEEWRPVVGYEGLYEVSNTGRVRSLDMYVKSKSKSYRLHKGKVLSPGNNSVDNLEWCDRSYNNTYGTRQDKVRDTNIKNGYWTGLSRKESTKKYYQENRDRICEQKKEYRRKKKEENIQNNV